MSILGFLVIVILYLVIGVMAARGTISIFQKMFTPKSEQIFYGIFLILVAGVYLAFTAYFRAAGAWRLETIVVVAFVLLGVLGMRLPFALIVGFPLHGVWDLVHELQAHAGDSMFGQLTAIPLAYGFFCAAFDFYVAGYFYQRRGEWSGAWK